MKPHRNLCILCALNLVVLACAGVPFLEGSLWPATATLTPSPSNTATQPPPSATPSPLPPTRTPLPTRTPTIKPSPTVYISPTPSSTDLVFEGIPPSACVMVYNRSLYRLTLTLKNKDFEGNYYIAGATSRRIELPAGSYDYTAIYSGISVHEGRRAFYPKCVDWEFLNNPAMFASPTPLWATPYGE